MVILDPHLRESELGSVDGLSTNDLPPGCDMTIMPYGNPKTQVGDKIYVVWEGYRRGLFYCWDDTALSVNYYSGARHKAYHGLDNARLAYYLGRKDRPDWPSVSCVPPRTAKARGKKARASPPRSSAQQTPPRTTVFSSPPSAKTSSIGSSSPVPDEKTSTSGSFASARSAPTADQGDILSTPPTPPWSAPVPDEKTSTSGSFASARSVPTADQDDILSTPPTPPSPLTPRRPPSTSPSTEDSRGSSKSSLSTTRAYREPRAIIEISSDEDDDRVYVVTRGRRPGVYKDQYRALACLGKSNRGRMRPARNVVEGNALFVRLFMEGPVEVL